MRANKTKQREYHYSSHDSLDVGAALDHPLRIQMCVDLANARPRSGQMFALRSSIASAAVMQDTATAETLVKMDPSPHLIHVRAIAETIMGTFGSADAVIVLRIEGCSGETYHVLIWKARQIRVSAGRDLQLPSPLLVVRITPTLYRRRDATCRTVTISDSMTMIQHFL